MFGRQIRQAIGKIVAKPAAVQAAKGIVSAGLTKSFKYAWEKRSKSKPKRSS